MYCLCAQDDERQSTLLLRYQRIFDSSQIGTCTIYDTLSKGRNMKKRMRVRVIPTQQEPYLLLPLTVAELSLHGRLATKC